jgi:hypothetical protein
LQSASQLDPPCLSLSISLSFLLEEEGVLGRLQNHRWSVPDPLGWDEAGVP